MFLTEEIMNGEVSFFRGKKGVEYEISTISGQRTAHFFLPEKASMKKKKQKRRNTDGNKTNAPGKAAAELSAGSDTFAWDVDNLYGIRRHFPLEKPAPRKS